MPESLRCPACGSRLPDASPAPGEGVFCAACGGVVRPQVADWNPYAAPSADLADRGEGAILPRVVPRSLVGKLALTLGLLGSNLPLFGAIVLTVWLPANILIEVLSSGGPPEQQAATTIRLNSIFQGIFGALETGALTYAAARRLEGRRVGYGEAMAVGVQNWGRLFAANFFAGLRILVGLIALVIPGIILSVRYALLAPAVVLEQSPDPRGRSTELTRGRGWAIFVTMIAVYALNPLFVWTADLAAEQFEAFDSMAWSVTSDCLADVLGSAFAIAMVVFYAEGRQAESESESEIAEVADDPL